MSHCELPTGPQALSAGALGHLAARRPDLQVGHQHGDRLAPRWFPAGSALAE